jgi:uncharacterized membrane protein YphA (DoxX/SURF4 family)
MGDTDMTTSIATPRVRTYLAWTLQILLAAAFLAAGLSKLAGVPMMVDLFDRIGVGQWFRYVTGLVEIGGAVLLLVPGLAGAGAAFLAATMAGAVLAHLAILGDSPAAALVLLALNLVVLALRREQVQALRARLLG